MVGKTKALRIAFNMLTCATVFALAKPWPRETISGLIGRKYDEHVRGFVKYTFRVRLWTVAMQVIDKLHRPREQFHCYETYQLEKRARRVLGYHE